MKTLLTRITARRRAIAVRLLCSTSLHFIALTLPDALAPVSA